MCAYVYTLRNYRAVAALLHTERTGQRALPTDAYDAETHNPNDEHQTRMHDPVSSIIASHATQLDSRRSLSHNSGFFLRFLRLTNGRAVLVNGNETQYLGKFPYIKNIQ